MAVEGASVEAQRFQSVTALPGDMPRPIVVTMIGAGSGFTNSILKDVALIPGNRGGELRLVDIDPDRLALAEALMRKIAGEVRRFGGSEVPGFGEWTIRASTDREELLPGTDYIVNSIEVSGLECVRADNDIPLEYGVSQCIGDTIGPGGLFKGLRTIPAWIEILRGCERLCPNALVLNYTNPMNMMVLAASRASSMRVVGLCHSVQGTSRMLARFAGVEYERMRWKCAGINHLAWFTELRGPDGEDLYPALMSQARDPESDLARKEPVRSDVMLHFGAFVTESSGHLSEYLPYYRKRPDLRQKHLIDGYGGQESFYADNWPDWRKKNDEWRKRLLAGEEPIELERSLEYGAWIIEAAEKNSPIVIHGNVAPNDGLIPNLMSDGCVEVACAVDRDGIRPTRFGRLPNQMAAVCESNMRMFDLAVDAALNRSKEAAALALMLDPLSAAVCSPAEIREMTMRMFEAEAEHLKGYS